MRDLGVLLLFVVCLSPAFSVQAADADKKVSTTGKTSVADDCKLTLTDTSQTLSESPTKRITRINKSHLIDKPEEYLGYLLKHQGFKFRVFEVEDFDVDTRTLASNLELLSVDQEVLREEVILGNDDYNQRKYQIDGPLDRLQENYPHAEFVEVFAAHFRFEDGTSSLIYVTNNEYAALGMDEYQIVWMYQELMEQGKVVTSARLIHTHPQNLIPSRSDHMLFKTTKDEISKLNPNQSFEDWYALTTMEDEDHFMGFDMSEL